MNAAMDVIFFLPFLWVISYVRSQTEPTILNISPYEYVSLELKESVKLYCIIQNNSGYTLSWKREVNSTIEQISTNETLIIKNNRFAVNFNNATSTYNLAINETEQSDIGTYTCEISDGQNNNSTKETKVELIVQPYFYNSTEKEVKVDEGDNFTIKCYAGGNPKPTVTIQRDDASFSDEIFSHPGSEWKIENITKKYEGNYTCRADTSIGSESRKIRILVNSKPIFQNCSINLHYEPAFSAEFVCVIDSVTSVDVAWFRNGKKLTDSGNVKTFHCVLGNKFHVVKLNISNVEKHGAYSVAAKNDRGIATQNFSFSNGTESVPANFQNINESALVNSQSITECVPANSHNIDKSVLPNSQNITERVPVNSENILFDTNKLRLIITVVLFIIMCVLFICIILIVVVCKLCRVVKELKEVRGRNGVENVGNAESQQLIALPTLNRSDA